jgi:hypothetical protein
MFGPLRRLRYTSAKTGYYANAGTRGGTRLRVGRVAVSMQVDDSTKGLL